MTAPVASPEAKTGEDRSTCLFRDHAGESPLNCTHSTCRAKGLCIAGLHTAPPAGPETGWLTRDANDYGIDFAHIYNKGPEWERVKRWMDEAKALRAALSAATERADLNRIGGEACQREADKMLEQNVALKASLTASESRCAAALKLAGEAVDWADALAEHNNDSTYDTQIASARSRLAALSSPSAPGGA